MQDLRGGNNLLIIAPVKHKSPKVLNARLGFFMASQARGFILSCLLILGIVSQVWAMEIPNNLWMGIVSEDTRGDYQTYLAIASCVRNRLAKGMNTGLIALKRQNLRQFVKENCDYMLKTKKIDLTKLATKAIQEVWQGKDYAFGATNYEHTGHYPIPKYTKKMKLVKVMYRGQKKEIKFWK